MRRQSDRTSHQRSPGGRAAVQDDGAARGTGNVDEQRYVAEHVVEDLSVHAVIEEEILYPAMREVLPDGDRLVNEALQEHQEAKELLTRIDGKDPQSEDARRAFDELVGAIEHHVEEEEGEPSRLRGALGQERLQQMGQPAKRHRPIRIRTYPTRLPATSPPGVRCRRRQGARRAVALRARTRTGPGDRCGGTRVDV